MGKICTLTTSRTNVPVELSFTGEYDYQDIFNEVEVDVLFTSADGVEWKVPAFWAGGDCFRVRFAAPRPGRYLYRSTCTNLSDLGLHGQTGELEVEPYSGGNPLYQHGRLQTAESMHTLEHTDGTPFFWLGDTCWMLLSKRLDWPHGFNRLVSDRVGKGFTVMQLVAGLFPDMAAFDERGASEAGFPWDREYSRINAEYFDAADRRIIGLVESGLLPCIVGCWGYYLPWMGIEKMKEHWRNIVARYGAYPVVWCLAGEAIQAWYLSEDSDRDAEYQKKGWTALAEYVRDIDPYKNPITIHPRHPDARGREMIDDPVLLDFEMLQTGHNDLNSLPATLDKVIEASTAIPRMPLLNGEVCYEGVGGFCRDNVQRLMFWSCILNGACGHTYGANGIWQVNGREQPYGPSPHGMTWDGIPWEDACDLPGSSQLAMSKRLLERYDWWRFEPHPEWAEPHRSKDNYFAPSASGIPGEVRFIYMPEFPWKKVIVRRIEPWSRYRAFLFDPITGKETHLGTVEPDSNGDWTWPQRLLPKYQDWLLVLDGSAL